MATASRRPRWAAVAALAATLVCPAAALGVERSVRRPVGDGDLDMVAGLLKQRLLAAKEQLAADTKEGDFCKEQLKEVSVALKKESKVVKEKLEVLRAAKKKAAAAVDYDPEKKKRVRDASHQQVDAEMKLDEAARAMKAAQASEKLGLAALRRNPAVSADAELRDAKYELRKAMEGLSRAVKEHDILHDRCVANAGREQSYEERARARQDELDSLRRAHEMLSACGPTGC
mmetsp:Transcript_84284/g.243631  ORF Transcript_84284/g.243631 Transcript_84284/m.243631 type:complete len:231 (-) Transcript_84284:18-710(-)